MSFQQIERCAVGRSPAGGGALGQVPGTRASRSLGLTPAGAPHRPDARPGRARARFSLLLPALALLLGAPGLFTPAPAQAQTTVWSATLTVGQVEENALGSRVGCNYQEPCASRLSDDDFEVGGAAYTVRGVWAFTGGTMDGALEVRFSENPNAALEALNFCVGSTAYPLAGATSRFYRWPAGPDWTAGDRVALSIAATCGATTPVTPPVTTPEVGFELGSYSAAEHLGEIAAALTLSSALSQASTVTVSVKGGATATSGTDFMAPTSIALPAGTTYVVFTVPVTDDSEVEQDETFTLVLSAVQSAPYTVSASAGEARVPELRRAEAEVGEAEQRVAVLVELVEEPRRGPAGVEELDVMNSYS